MRPIASLFGTQHQMVGLVGLNHQMIGSSRTTSLVSADRKWMDGFMAKNN